MKKYVPIDLGQVLGGDAGHRDRITRLVLGDALVAAGDVEAGVEVVRGLLAAVGEPDIVEKLKAGHTTNGKEWKVHIDGYNFLPYLTGETDEGPRDEIFYFSDDGDLTALRWQDWKIIFMEQRVEATLQAWAEPFVPLRVPLIFNLRRDPYERSQVTSNTYYDWLIDRAYLLVPAQTYVAQFLGTFKDYPPRQKAASFSLDQVMEQMQQGAGPH